ncbi:MAG: alpha/beta hydrolase [Prevotella sp.]|nr:alpha/beta hydrolase [Prevotella sp.]MBO7128472.1 alpha/beta hydrolase [Prevotella sp.]
MKKVFLYTSITLLILIFVSVIVVWNSFIHVQLPHGAVLHVLPGYRNKQAEGAVIMCPGGGYSYLEKWYEGYQWFPFFYMQGYTPAMLEYRMPKHNYKSPMTDGAEAIQMMRQRANEWHFDKNNVGIVGFSAGGHLASTMMVIDNDLVRPDFGILFYPVISMKKELTHIDSHNQLLGRDASEQLEEQFSNELHVTEKTPPAFIAVANDDKAVSPQNSILFYDGMRAMNRPASLRVYPSGGHGFVCRLRSKYRSQVLEDLTDWLHNRQNE